MGKLLIFAMTEDRRQAAIEICRELNAQVVEVSPSAYDLRLSEILSENHSSFSAKGGGKALAAPMPKEMAVFAGFDSVGIDIFLEHWRKRGCSPIDLKAAVTFTNLQWTPRKLFAELLQEHMSFRK